MPVTRRSPSRRLGRGARDGGLARPACGAKLSWGSRMSHRSLLATAAVVLTSCYFSRGAIISARTEEGRPLADPGPGDAYLVWHDRAGWHLRARSDVGHVFEGLVESGRLGAVERVGLAPEALRAGEGAIAFTFVPDPSTGEAGFDWQGGCAEFSLFMDGDPHPLRIFAGAYGASPPRIPFALCP